MRHHVKCIEGTRNQGKFSKEIIQLHHIGETEKSSHGTTLRKGVKP